MLGVFKAGRGNEVSVRSISIGGRYLDSLPLSHTAIDSFPAFFALQFRKTEKNHRQTCRLGPSVFIKTLSNPNSQPLVL